jgi:hypothetical protein
MLLIWPGFFTGLPASVTIGGCTSHQLDAYAFSSQSWLAQSNTKQNTYTNSQLDSLGISFFVTL